MPPRQTRASTAVLLHLAARGRRRTVSPAWETARRRDKASPPPSPGRRRKREGRRWRRKKMDGNLTAVVYTLRLRHELETPSVPFHSMAMIDRQRHVRQQTSPMDLTPSVQL
uniref:Uncharacterized protein n=1 Tax=Oryza nivara TaxID=4536 RepID=A0A0E0FZS2_ORYNI